VAKRRQQGNPRLNATAASIGKAFGKVAARIDSWQRQRAEITRDIHEVISKAQGLLHEVGHGPTSRAVGSLAEIAHVRRGGRQKGFKMSAAARRKISIAAKRRWAAKKAAEKK
jgi:hypothetical protein